MFSIGQVSQLILDGVGREMPACRVCCSASHLAAKDPRVKHSRLWISRWSNSRWPGPLPRHRARGRLVAKASGGSSDVDDDEEVPGAGAQQQKQKQQQGKVNVHELLDDFFAYFNSTFPDTVMPLLQKDDLGSRRALLGHIVAARRKIDTIRKAGKDTLSVGDRVYVSLVANILKVSAAGGAAVASGHTVAPRAQAPPLTVLPPHGRSWSMPFWRRR